ncbi:unnamed protein product [Pleuronectes platessa]|uniref:Uncharacterized protein n=1 Tax=Pleuronectes platessa TaxID=8262 RepID=A0A9N7UPR6_PLEPL|nr:unnamed protein product [Pleuronectes platessa]
MGIQSAQGRGRGQNLSEAALPGGQRERRGSSLCPPHSLFLSVPLVLSLRGRCSPSFPPTTLNLYLLYLVCGSVSADKTLLRGGADVAQISIWASYPCSASHSRCPTRDTPHIPLTARGCSPPQDPQTVTQHRNQP